MPNESKIRTFNILTAPSRRRQFIKTTTSASAIAFAASMLPVTLQAATGLVAYVHTQAAGDNGPVDSMIGRLKQLSGEQGFKFRTVYAQDPATFETIFRTLGDAGASVVISTFNEVTEPFKAVAPSYPNTKWVQLFADPFKPAIPNIVSVSYDYYLGCYISGIFAAQVSKTGKIGYIGGISIPPLNADFNALKAGALSVNPKISVKAAFAGSFQDPAKGFEIANQMYSEGIDYIQTDSAATDGGIIQAANEASGRMVSAIDPAQYPLGPKSVIAIVALDFGQSLYNEVSKANSSKWAGGTHVSTGIDSGVIDFILSPVFKEQGPKDLVERAAKAWPKVVAARNGILNGSIKVPFNTNL